MKNSNLLLVGIGALIFVALVAGMVVLAKPKEGKLPGAPAEKGIPLEREKGTAPTKEVESKPETAAEFSATLEDKVGGNRSGRVTVSSDPFTGESKYSITVSGLPKPEGAASYHIWINRVDEKAATDQGKIEVADSGQGSLTFNNVTPKEGWQVQITYQPKTEDYAPGTIVLEGTLKKE